MEAPREDIEEGKHRGLGMAGTGFLELWLIVYARTDAHYLSTVTCFVLLLVTYLHCLSWVRC